MASLQAILSPSVVSCGPTPYLPASSRNVSSSRVSMSTRPHGSDFWGSALEVSSPCARPEQYFAAALPKIEAAISKEKKNLTVERARKELEDCYCIAAINYQRLTVKQFQTLRRNLPETTTLLVCKNSLLGKAIEGTKFEALSPAMTGMNAFLFIHTEEVPAALKPYRELQKELKLEVNDFTGAVFEGKFYAPDDMKSLETMPTRLEIYAKLLGTLKGPSTQVVGVLQAPARDLVYTLKAFVAKLEAEQGAPPS